MQKKGLTLIEIVVAVTLIGISLVALAAIVNSGRRLLKLTENDAQALSIALARKEELLSRSFSHPDLHFDPANPQNSQRSGTIDNFFTWRTTVTEHELRGPNRRIPYKEIDVTVEYPEETAPGAAAGNIRRVTLRDIVPYPFVHVESVNSGIEPCEVADGCEVLFWGNNPHHRQWTVVAEPLSQNIGVDPHNLDNALRIDLPPYPVVKDFLVIYDIAINIEDAADLDPPDTILTRAVLRRPGATLVGIPTTRTPIISQGSISNILTFANAPADTAHSVEVQWQKDTEDGDISVEMSSLTVIAMEDQGN